MSSVRNSVLSALLMLSPSIAVAESEQLDDNWVLMIGDNPSNYEVVTSVSKQSENTIKNEYATNDVRPELAFRCVPGNEAITVQIDWRRFISSFNTEVGFSVDGGAVLWQKWGVDRSNKTTMSRSEGDSRALIGRLAGASELTVEVAPYSGSPLTVHFDLAGYSRALDALSEACR